MANKFNLSDNIINNPKLKPVSGEYQLSDELKTAVEVAMCLKMPLLLTGKPGTGKTRLAFKLAADLHSQFKDVFLEEPLIFNTKSTSSYTDLFYKYDAVGHFYNANIKEAKSTIKPNAEDHIEINALGKAIIISNQENIKKALKYKGIKSNQAPIGAVVLIDEIDKAPRDFTNDLLNELDRFEFTVNETSQTFKYEQSGENSKKIFLILTSNSEKNLPEAFLRRCIYFDIQPPDEDFIFKIVSAHFRETDKSVLKTFVDKFQEIKKLGLNKEATTAELCNWIYYLKDKINQGEKFDNIDLEIRKASISILAKNQEDRKTIIEKLGLK